MKIIRGVDYENENDAALMQRIVNKDSQAFEMFYDQHAKAIFTTLVRLVKDPNIAEDLVQETFWQVWRKAEQFTGAGTVASWLFRIARNKAFDHLRQKKSHGRPLYLDWETMHTVECQMTHISFPNNSTEEDFYRRLTVNMVQIALLEIPTEQRVCLEMAYFEDMTHSEISTSVHVPLGTIKRRIQSGVKKLRRNLQARSVYSHI